MIGVVMAGGKGTRMESSQEKLLLRHKKPIILHVIDALKDSECFSKVIAIASPNAPKTKKLLEQTDVEIIDTLGNGYVSDLNQVLSSLNDPILVTSGDLPLLDGEIIKKIVTLYNPENVWSSIIVTKAFLDSLQITSNFLISFQGQQCFFTGISLVNAKKIKSVEQVKENHQILDDKRVAFNINTKQDCELLGIS